MDYRSFFYFLIKGLTLSILLIGGFNFIINPYELFSMKRIEYVNLKKPYIHKFIKEAKVTQFKSIQPKTLLLGNSIVEIGINPRSHFWPDDFQGVFNFGIPGQGVVGNLENLDIINIEKVERIVVFISFLDFLEKKESKLSSFQENSLRKIEPEYSKFFQSLFSISAFIDSLKTVFAQYRPYVMNVNEFGFNTNKPLEGEIKKFGHYQIIEQKKQSMENKYNQKDWFVDFDSGYFDVINKRTKDIANQNKKVLLIIYPFHQSVYDLLKTNDLYHYFHEFKDKLRKQVKQVNRSLNSNFNAVELWDFSELNEYTKEPLPESNQSDEMKWYWEMVHFRHELGDKILETLFSQERDKTIIGRQLE